jgi:hypothetical protein
MLLGTLGTIRGGLVLAFCAIIAGCVQTDQPPDTSYRPVSLIAPFNDLPLPPPGTTIEAGTPVTLDARQQEAVVTGILKWMKDPRSASFSELRGARNSHGWITVCGSVNGRNTAGAYVGMAPFIGVLSGETKPVDPRKPSDLEFVVVEIGAFAPQRTDVETLCNESGIPSKL